MRLRAGEATTVDLEILWPSGTVQTLEAVPANQVVEVDEDGGIVAPAAETSPAGATTE